MPQGVERGPVVVDPDTDNPDTVYTYFYSHYRRARRHARAPSARSEDRAARGGAVHVAALVPNAVTARVY